VLQTSQPQQNTTTRKHAENTFMDLWAKHLMGAPITARMPLGAANVDNGSSGAIGKT
jgi:hypothetical protein